MVAANRGPSPTSEGPIRREARVPEVGRRGSRRRPRNTEGRLLPVRKSRPLVLPRSLFRPGRQDGEGPFRGR
jgi:hypothetical protein